MNGLRYQTMINEFLRPELEDMDVDDVYFQQGRVISRNVDYNWLPRSCDLTPLDFLLQGYVKYKVYADAPQSIQELKEKIRAVIDKIEHQMCENVMGNFIKRAVEAI